MACHQLLAQELAANEDLLGGAYKNQLWEFLCGNNKLFCWNL